MNSKILERTLVFALLATMQLTSKACTPPVEAVINSLDPTWVHVNHTLCFDGSDSWGEGGICQWQWDFGDGSDPDGNIGRVPDCDVTDPYSYKVEHAYSNVGTYYPELWVEDFYNHEDTDSFTLYVIDIDLTADSTYLCRDLVPIHLSIATSKGDDKARLLVSPIDYPDESNPWAASIKIWADQEKTQLIIPHNGEYHREWSAGYFATEKTWYVEGIPSSSTVYPWLTFQYLGVHPPEPDRIIGPSPYVNFTVGTVCPCYTSLVNETLWSAYFPQYGTTPTSCYPPCDGEDSYELDDCLNELEVSCATKSGGGGVDCAYRVFYNNSLLSSCVFRIEPHNEVVRKMATIEGTDKQVFTKIKHINECHKYTGGCFGWYCTKFYEYDCITGASSTTWRKKDDEHPLDEGDGVQCPGHGPK